MLMKKLLLVFLTIPGYAFSVSDENSSAKLLKEMAPRYNVSEDLSTTYLLEMRPSELLEKLTPEQRAEIRSKLYREFPEKKSPVRSERDKQKSHKAFKAEIEKNIAWAKFHNKNIDEYLLKQFFSELNKIDSSDENRENVKYISEVIENIVMSREIQEKAPLK